MRSVALTGSANVAFVHSSLWPNTYEAPGCQGVKRSLREESGLAHSSSDRDFECCAPLT